MKALIYILLMFAFICSPLLIAKGTPNNVQYNSQKLQSQNNNVVKSATHAAKLVKKRYGGKVLSSKKSSKGRYKVKLLKDDGHIISVSVNAKTGKIKG